MTLNIHLNSKGYLSQYELLIDGFDYVSNIVQVNPDAHPHIKRKTLHHQKWTQIIYIDLLMVKNLWS